MPALFGDASRPGILRHAHLERTGVGRAVVGERELALAIIRYAFGTFGVRGDRAAVAAETLQLPDPHTGRRRGGGTGQPIPGARDG